MTFEERVIKQLGALLLELMRKDSELELLREENKKLKADSAEEK